MKLLMPFKVGDVIRTNYETGPYRIIDITDGCTCPNYVDRINNGQDALSREGHLHFILVSADEPVTKSGTYAERKQFYLGGYAYKNGECVDIDGPHAKGTAGWHKKDDGLDKIVLVKAAAISNLKLIKPNKRTFATENTESAEGERP